MYFDKERMVAVAAVQDAAKLCRKVRSELVSDDTLAKKDRSPVTIADYGAQAVVNHLLSKDFPDDPIVGEESASALREPDNEEMTYKICNLVRETIPGIENDEVLDTIDRGHAEGGVSGRFWTLDPIDGTKGFLRQGQYAVALALVVDRQVVLGVLGCPNMPRVDGMPDNGLGRMFIAVRGSGCFERGFGEDATEWKITVDEIDDTAAAVFCESVESGHSSQTDSAKVAELLGVTEPPVRMDSQCKYGVVSRGEASLYLRLPTRGLSGPNRYIERIWDHAAGSIVIEEAGGRVTDLFGKPLNFGLGRGLDDNVGIIVTNGRLHERVLKAVQNVLGVTV